MSVFGEEIGENAKANMIVKQLIRNGCTRDLADWLADMNIRLLKAELELGQLKAGAQKPGAAGTGKGGEA